MYTSLSPGVCSYEFDDFLSIGANSGASGVQSPVTDNRTLSFIAAVKLTCQNKYQKNNSRKIIKMTALNPCKAIAFCLFIVVSFCISFNFMINNVLYPRLLNLIFTHSLSYFENKRKTSRIQSLCW